MQRGKEAELLAILHALELTTKLEISEISAAWIHLVPFHNDFFCSLQSI